MFLTVCYSIKDIEREGAYEYIKGRLEASVTYSFGIPREEIYTKYGFLYNFKEVGEEYHAELYTLYKSNPTFVNDLVAQNHKIWQSGMLTEDKIEKCRGIRNRIKQYILNKEEGILEVID